jgi:glycosyltransferase involved in cell wall biosynthesis
MPSGHRTIVVMPAYKAALTLERVWADIPKDAVDEVIVVDDCSPDETAVVARRLPVTLIEHERNTGYGGNQKTCYREALRHDADVVVMLHPDYQYTPKLLVAMASMIAVGEYDVVLGSRVLCQSPMAGGMPFYKLVSNRFLTLFENILLGQRVSEYHTGYRAFSRDVLEKLPLEENSDDFVFDNQMLAQVVHFGFRLGEISCPTKYFDDASSISFRRSVKYGLGVLQTSVAFWLHHRGLIQSRLFKEGGERLLLEHRPHVHHPDPAHRAASRGADAAGS